MSEPTESPQMSLLDSALSNPHRRKHGLNVLFAGSDKAPKTLWEKWQKTPQSDKDVHGIYVEDASCWGFICGFNGLESFDFDWPWVYRLWRKQFSERAETLTTRTPNGGYRPYFFVNTPNTEMAFKESLHTEIKGPGQFAVHEGEVKLVSGEIGAYRLELDLEIRRDDEIVEDTVKWLQELNQRYEFLQWSCLKEKYFSKKTIPDLPHETRLMIADIMVYNGTEQDEILNFFEDQSDFKRSITLYQTRYTEKQVQKGLKPPRCETLRKTLHWSKEDCKGCSRKLTKDSLQMKEIQVVKTPFVELSDGRLAEQGYDGKKAYYIVYDSRDGSVNKEDFLVESEVRYKPIMNRDVDTLQVLLPSNAVEYGSEKDLWNQVITYLDYWHEERNRKERILDAAYDYATYLRDLLPVIGYRRKLAPYGKGKTTSIDVNGAISYRPFYLAGCSSEASIRRLFDLWRGTAVLDEADFGRSDLYAVIIKILNIGDDARLGWYRCCDENDPSKVLSFYVYGPKHIATRKRFKDIATESRCLTSATEENRSPKPLFRSRQFLEQSREIRNKLLMWKFKHYRQFKEKIGELEDPNIAERIFGKDFNVSGRIKQILIPVALAIEDKAITNILKEAGSELSEVLKSLDKEQTTKDQVDGALRQILTELQDAKELQDYRSAKRDLVTGILKVRLPDITRRILGQDANSDDLKSLSQQVRDYLVDRRHLPVRAETDNVRWVYLGSETLIDLGFESLAAPIKPVIPSDPVILKTSGTPKIEDQDRDWKTRYPDFFSGAKEALKVTKSSGSLAICYTCWMSPKYRYQEMLAAKTIRWEPIKPTGEYMCQLCGKEAAGYKVIL